jgi:hypothetical protein
MRYVTKNQVNTYIAIKRVLFKTKQAFIDELDIIISEHAKYDEFDENNRLSKINSPHQRKFFTRVREKLQE